MVFRLAHLLLCWWHVLRAWEKHLSKKEADSELWQLLKAWIRISDQAEFQATWVKIQALGSRKFVEYMTRNYMSPEVLRMWSAVHRVARNIVQSADTNMGIEACVSSLASRPSDVFPDGIMCSSISSWRANMVVASTI